MFLEATLISLSATGLGAYYCISNEIITPEKVNACSNNLDKKCFELCIKLMNGIENTIEIIENKVNEIIDADEEKQHIDELDADTDEIINSREEEKQSLLTNDSSDEVELELKVVEVEKTPESSNVNLDEFVILEQENQDN